MCIPQVPRPHASVGWVLSDDCSALEAAVAKLNVQSAQQLQSPTLTVKVWCLMHVVSLTCTQHRFGLAAVPLLGWRSLLTVMRKCRWKLCAVRLDRRGILCGQRHRHGPKLRETGVDFQSPTSTWAGIPGHACSMWHINTWQLLS